MNWEKLFLKYVWNDQTTPYLTPLAKLNRRQGNSEILIYSLFVGLFFGAIALISLTDGGPSHGIAYYGFTVVCAAALFIILKSYAAALYLSATPAVALAYLYFHGLSDQRPLFDTIVVTLLLLLLLRYSLRIVNIAKVYPELPDRTPAEADPDQD